MRRISNAILSSSVALLIVESGEPHNFEMTEVLNERNDVGVPGRIIESHGVQVGVQVRKSAYPPFHADFKHQVDDQLLDYRFLLAVRQLESLQPHHHRVYGACDRCSEQGEDPPYNACRLTGTTLSRHLCVVRHNFGSMFYNSGCGGEHGVPIRSQRVETNEPISATSVCCLFKCEIIATGVTHHRH